MDLHLSGKRALVTGGSRGIGKAIARILAEEGCDVAIAARDAERLAAAAAELSSATGRRVVGIPVDTGDDDSVRAMVAAVTEALGGVDILVNNAARPGGQSAPPTLATLTRSDLFDEVEVKVMGYLRCAQAVAPQMIERGWGRIVNVSGLAARSTGSIVGSIRNVAVAAMTKNLADELGRHGITVTVVHPGLTRTEATPGVIAARAAAAGLEPAVVEARMAQGNALKRIVDADEVAAVVAFLASPRAAAITGDAVACGGGQPGPIFY
jgi:NAD(P)-dependent dehydrogenase (short-subunit alcohol dehydrogenase family)